MKLYTEEQIRNAMRADFILDEEIDNLINKLTPIELPSDEEMQQYLNTLPYTKHLDDGQYNDGVIVGAEMGIEWVRNKIQGGNNEQQ